jgi:phospholipase C
MALRSAGWGAAVANRLVDTSVLTTDLKNGTLPQVSWVIPSNEVSEHPPSSVHAGMAYVTDIVNAIMQSSSWNTTAIFVAWDDWGGFYDHVPPPRPDRYGFGIRVPGLEWRSPSSRKRACVAQGARLDFRAESASAGPAEKSS